MLEDGRLWRSPTATTRANLDTRVTDSPRAASDNSGNLGESTDIGGDVG